MELRETHRRQAAATPSHLPPVKNTNQLVPGAQAYLRLTCATRSLLVSSLTSLGTWKTRVWLQNTIKQWDPEFLSTGHRGTAGVVS